MSDDLISRKAVMSHIENEYRQWGEDYDAEQIMGDIEDFPTAYDVDEIVKSINEIGKRYCNSVKCDKNCEDCEHGCLMRAITSTVKSGGVAND